MFIVQFSFLKSNPKPNTIIVNAFIMLLQIILWLIRSVWNYSQKLEWLRKAICIILGLQRCRKPLCS